MKVIREFAKKTMGTSEVILDASVNQHVWAKGIKSVPRRIRVKLERYEFYMILYLFFRYFFFFYSKPKEDEEAKEKMVTLVTLVPVESFKGLQTKVVE